VSANRSVLITGAGRGLGEALQSAFAADGWTNLPLVRKAEQSVRLKERWGGACVPIVADLSSDGAIATIEKALGENVQGLDVLINNAGLGGKASRLADVTSGEILELFGVHCLGAFRATQAAAPWLRNPDRAFVINVSSRLGSLARNASGEFAGSNVSVFAVHPGKVQTASGSSDADVPPAVAAARILRWLDAAERDGSARFVEPGVGELPW